MIFYNGTLLTQDPSQPIAEALAVENGRIVTVGSQAEVENLAKPGTRRIDLGGRTLIPGFNDAHVHFWKVGHLLTTLLDVREVRSIPALQSSIQTFSDRLPDGAWLMGRGYNEAVMAEGRHPTRYDLDAVLPDRPAYLIRTCAHIAVVNSRALELAGITADTQPPPGGMIDRDEQGEPNGILRETAMGLVFNRIPAPTPAEYEAMLLAATRHHLELGITSATDPGVMPELLSVYRQMDAEQKFTHRLNVMAIRRPDGGTETLPLPEQYLSNHLRVDSVKFFADGALSGAAAALSIPYRNLTTRGVLRFEADEFFELAREAHVTGLRIGTHAIGDRALEMVLSTYERLNTLGPRIRHRIEHFGLASPEHMRRAKSIGVMVAPQTIFLYVLGANFRRYLPDELMPRCYPVREMIETGLTVALSSDAPVVKDDNPLRGMQAAILRADPSGATIAPEQAISAEQALYCYTMGGAIASGDEENRGSLTVGKWADLAVLSDNPLKVDPAALTDIQVDMTFVGGKLVFER
ncbi:MAG: amidohydrolase [Chloroflexi bacterium]|nr:amidohydrolase [Chloroflexota bacterium]